jgi:hypothetical protein
VLPGGGLHAGELCAESDGIVVSLQHADGRRHAEIKAMVAYAGKERHGKKVQRIHPVSFGCTGTPDRMWRQGIAAAARMLWQASALPMPGASGLPPRSRFPCSQHLSMRQSAPGELGAVGVKVPANACGIYLGVPSSTL